MGPPGPQLALRLPRYPSGMLATTASPLSAAIASMSAGITKMQFFKGKHDPIDRLGAIKINGG